MSATRSTGSAQAQPSSRKQTTRLGHFALLGACLKFSLSQLYFSMSTLAGMPRVSSAISRSPTSNSDSANTLHMISDGKRKRTVWQPGCGDGSSIPHIVQRSRATVNGHPTWRIFIDDIVQPIVRGSDQEPPHYVYLDDQACFTIWKSQCYTDTELRTYWPFDFDHQGNIQRGRPNRGRAAWTETDPPQIARGKLRGKGKWYAFSGEPGIMLYPSRRPATRTTMELQVETEWSEMADRSAGIVSTEGTPNPSIESSPMPLKHMQVSDRATLTQPLNAPNRSGSLGNLTMEEPGAKTQCSISAAVPETISRPKKGELTEPFLISSGSPRGTSKSPASKRSKLAGLRKSPSAASVESCELLCEGSDHEETEFPVHTDRTLKRKRV